MLVIFFRNISESNSYKIPGRIHWRITGQTLTETSKGISAGIPQLIWNVYNGNTDEFIVEYPKKQAQISGGIQAGASQKHLEVSKENCLSKLIGIYLKRFL